MYHKYINADVTTYSAGLYSSETEDLAVGLY